MPKPTLQNRRYFKSYLKRYRDRFTSGIQTCQVSDISGMFSSSIAGLSTNQSVKVLLIGGNDYDTPTVVDNVFTPGSFVYFPASAGDYANLTINSFNYKLYFASEDGGITFNGNTYGIGTTFSVGTKSLTVKALGGALVETQNGPTYSVGVSTTIVNEGSSVTFTVTTTGISTGTTLYYTTTGPVSATDFSNNSLSGSFVISNNTGSIVRTLVSDGIFENEDFTLEIRTTSTSGAIVAESPLVIINNVEPSYSVGVSTTTINEGGTVNFIVNTTNVSAGTTLYYSTDGTVSANDFTNNSLTGSFSIVGVGSTVGIATISRILSNEGGTEGTEYFTLSIRTGSTSGTVVATSSSVAVLNVEPSYNIGVSTTTINEGGTVNFTINTTDVGAGTSLYYSSSGTVSAADFTDNSLTGSFNIVGTGVTTGIATITRTIATDVFSDNAETFQLIVRTGSISGTIVATSSTVTINDVTPTYTVGVSTTIVNEGSSVTFTVTTTNLPNNTNLYYSTIGSGITASDFTNNSLTGSFAINNNSGSFSRTISGDRTTEGAEQFQIEIRTLSTSGSIVATSSTITINDTSRTPGADPSGKTFGPVQVNRDNGSTASTSDWYTICGIASLPAGSSIALFIDNSGSMTTATVQASYNLLLSKLAERNISIITVENGNEDWITPFLTELS